jgi:2-dehydropantoate 2-reductase
VGALRNEGDASDEPLTAAERSVARLLNEDAQLETHVSANIVRVQWTKLIMNLNNALDALSSLPIKRHLAAEAHRCVLAACQDEALRVFNASGIKLERMGLFIPRLAPHLLRLPNWLYLLITPLKVTDEARGSMVRLLVLSNSPHRPINQPINNSGKTWLQVGPLRLITSME